MSKTMIPLSSFEVYAITCLFVAAKAVELDERVPYISRMVKYFGKNISSNEIKDTERKILEALDWELQTSTMLDILEYYLSQGILFSNDEICLKKEEVNQLKVLMEKDYNSDSKKIEKDIRLIEKGIKYISTTDKEEFQKIENFNENQINFILKNIECQAYNYLEILLRGFLNFFR